MVKLPPLPDHPEPWEFKWTAQELKAITEYGQLCRDQALDEAEQACRSMQNGWPSDQHIECAKAIEELK